MNFWDILLADKLDGKDIPPHSYQLQEFESTGQTATFTASALPMPTLSTDIEASQDLHGYDKPWAGGEGKNKAQPPQAGVYSSEDGTFYPSDTYAYSKAVVAGDTQYTMSIQNLTQNSAVIFFDGNENFISAIDFPTQPLTVTTPSNCRYLVVESGGNNTPITPETIGNIQIEAGSTATEYAPYSNICPISGVDTIDIDVAGGESYTIDLDGTRYGGQLDVTSGVLTLTHGVVDMGDGGLEWIQTGPYFWCYVDGKKYGRTNMLSECYQVVDKPYTELELGEISGDNVSNAVSLRDSNYSSISDFTNAVSGIKLVYELATPQTIQLTPTQVWAVQGNNEITTTGQGLRGSYFKAI